MEKKLGESNELRKEIDEIIKCKLKVRPLLTLKNSGKILFILYFLWVIIKICIKK